MSRAIVIAGIVFAATVLALPAIDEVVPEEELVNYANGKCDFTTSSDGMTCTCNGETVPIIPCKVTLYSECDFKGHSSVLTAFEGSRSYETGVRPDLVTGSYNKLISSISSIQLDKGCTAELYQGPNYGGKRLEMLCRIKNERCSSDSCKETCKDKCLTNDYMLQQSAHARPGSVSTDRRLLFWGNALKRRRAPKVSWDGQVSSVKVTQSILTTKCSALCQQPCHDEIKAKDAAKKKQQEEKKAKREAKEKEEKANEKKEKANEKKEKEKAEKFRSHRESDFKAYMRGCCPRHETIGTEVLTFPCWYCSCNDCKSWEEYLKPYGLSRSDDEDRFGFQSSSTQP